MKKGWFLEVESQLGKSFKVSVHVLLVLSQVHK